jgi:hypothetical protein
MRVNNLICETLHPENDIAKLYKSKITEENKNTMIRIMNDALQRNDVNAYKNIVLGL